MNDGNKLKFLSDSNNLGKSNDKTKYFNSLTSIKLDFDQARKNHFNSGSVKLDIDLKKENKSQDDTVSYYFDTEKDNDQIKKMENFNEIFIEENSENKEEKNYVEKVNFDTMTTEKKSRYSDEDDDNLNQIQNYGSFSYSGADFNLEAVSSQRNINENIIEISSPDQSKKNINLISKNNEVINIREMNYIDNKAMDRKKDKKIFSEDLDNSILISFNFNKYKFDYDEALLIFSEYLSPFSFAKDAEVSSSFIASKCKKRLHIKLDKKIEQFETYFQLYCEIAINSNKEALSRLNISKNLSGKLNSNKSKSQLHSKKDKKKTLEEEYLIRLNEIKETREKFTNILIAFFNISEYFKNVILSKVIVTFLVENLKQVDILDLIIFSFDKISFIQDESEIKKEIEFLSNIVELDNGFNNNQLINQNLKEYLSSVAKEFNSNYFELFFFLLNKYSTNFSYFILNDFNRLFHINIHVLEEIIEKFLVNYYSNIRVEYNLYYSQNKNDFQLNIVQLSPEKEDALFSLISHINSNDGIKRDIFEIFSLETTHIESNFLSCTSINNTVDTIKSNISNISNISKSEKNYIVEISKSQINFFFEEEIFINLFSNFCSFKLIIFNKISEDSLYCVLDVIFNRIQLEKNETSHRKIHKDLKENTDKKEINQAISNMEDFLFQQLDYLCFISNVYVNLKDNKLTKKISDFSLRYCSNTKLKSQITIFRLPNLLTMISQVFI